MTPPQDLQNILAQGENTSVEFKESAVPVAGASLRDLHHTALDACFSSYEVEFSKEDEGTRTALLINADILTADAVPTVAGMLLFGINPGRFLPQSGIMFA